MADMIPFDYSSLPNDSRGKLMWFASEIRKAISGHVKAALEMGRLLSEAKELLPSETSFREWTAAEFGLSLRTAYNYISANENFGECANFARIELSAMYELTKNSGAKKAALRLADKGVIVTHEMAKQLVAKNTPAKPSAPPQAAVSDDIEDAEFSPVEPDSGSAESTEADLPKPATPKPTATEKDYGTCPNCAGTKWTTDDDGTACSRCHHPHGEPVGDKDADDAERAKIQRSKTVKTVEAAMRAFDELHAMLPMPGLHREALAGCKAILKLAKEWQ